MATSGTQAISRAVQILTAVARHDHGARLTDLSTSTGLSAPTARRILRCLIDERMVMQRSDDRRYYLGTLVAELGSNIVSYRVIAARCEPVLKRLAEVAQCSVHLTMRSGLDTVSIGHAITWGPVRITAASVGDRFPIGAGPAGVCMLASLERKDAEDIIAAIAPALPVYKGFTADLLREEVEFARKNKFASARERFVAGVTTIGVLVPEIKSWPALAMTAASLTESLKDGREAEIVQLLRAAVKEVADILSRAAIEN
jgi:DNA-binding IclR family transcriptional regulator